MSFIFSTAIGINNFNLLQQIIHRYRKRRDPVMSLLRTQKNSHASRRIHQQKHAQSQRLHTSTCVNLGGPRQRRRRRLTVVAVVGIQWWTGRQFFYSRFISGASRLTVAWPQWFMASSSGKKSLEMTSRSPRVFVTRENATSHVYRSLHIFRSADTSSAVN